MSQGIDYGNLMHEAMRGLIRKVLTDVEANGLPGSHHFFITYDTNSMTLRSSELDGHSRTLMLRCSQNSFAFFAL